MLSPVSIEGIQACMVGVSNAPNKDNKRSNILITIKAFCSDKKIATPKTEIPVKLSKAIIIYFRLIRSARIPPRGDIKIVGMVAIDTIPAKIAVEPLNSNIYIDKASFKIKFPNREILVPKQEG